MDDEAGHPAPEGNSTYPPYGSSKLGEQVNEHDHFTRFKSAHKRMAIAHIEKPLPTTTNGKTTQSAKQGILHSWFARNFKWEANLIVAGRTIEKGWVVPQSLGIALLVVILGGVGGLYWRIIDNQVESNNRTSVELQQQRDILIRLDQRMLDKEKHDTERNEDIQKRFQNRDAVDIVMNRDIQALKQKAGLK